MYDLYLQAHNENTEAVPAAPMSKSEIAAIQAKASKLLEKDAQAYKAGKFKCQVLTHSGSSRTYSLQLS